MQPKSRIQQLFTHNKGYIAYLTAGDGGIQRTLDASLALIAGGVNLLEIGIPFSDPIADGPVIQRAATRALEQGTNLDQILWLIKKIREKSQIGLVLFTYTNPLLKALETQFLQKAARAGIDGLLLVDCPLEESAPFHAICLAEGIDRIQVVTEATPMERVQQIDQQTEGFLYYACRKGITGMRDALPASFPEKIQAIQAVAQNPVAVGFGISNNSMVQQVLRHADGVVVGSFFVKALEDGLEPAALTTLARDIFTSEESHNEH